MKHYLTWKQIQQRLIQHCEEQGEPYSFFEAVRDLWLQGAYSSAPELPSVSFESWDAADLDQLEELLNQVPVDLEPFYPRFERQQSPQTAARHLIEFDAAPIRIAQHQKIGLHTHDAFEVYYMIRGQGHFLLGSNDHSLPENTICVVSPGFLHSATTEKGGLLLSVILAEQTLENTLHRLLMEESILTQFFRSSLTQHQGYLIFSNFNTRRTLQCFQGILQESFCPEAYSKTLFCNYIEILLADVLRHGKIVEHHSHGAGRQEKRNMLEILKYIQANYRQVSLQETARLFHYEASYLGKQIKEYTGKNYRSLINDLRLATAQKLILDTEYSIEEVSNLSGFSTTGNFTRSFKNQFGISPSAFRKQKRKE